MIIFEYKIGSRLWQMFDMLELQKLQLLSLISILKPSIKDLDDNIDFILECLEYLHRNFNILTNFNLMADCKSVIKNYIRLSFYTDYETLYDKFKDKEENWHKFFKHYLNYEVNSIQDLRHAIDKHKMIRNIC